MLLNFNTLPYTSFKENEFDERTPGAGLRDLFSAGPLDHGPAESPDGRRSHKAADRTLN